MLKIILVLATAVLAGCGPTSHVAQVTRFHEMAAPAGKSFVILPDEGQRDSLEFKNYANMVAAQLAAHGLRPAPVEQADLAVTMRYGVSDGRVQVWSSQRPDPDWYLQQRLRVVTPIPNTVQPVLPPYVVDPYLGTPYAGPYVAPAPMVTEVHSTTVFTRWLELNMLDAAKLRDGAGERVFEGRVTSEGSNRNLPDVMPSMVRALFTNFPGQSGETVTVTVQPEKRP